VGALGETIALFKPDAVEWFLQLNPEQIIRLSSFGAYMLEVVGLELQMHTHRILRTDEVETIYAKDFYASDEAEEKIRWAHLPNADRKTALVAHMTSGPIEAYLAYDAGDRAMHKAKRIRDALRRRFVESPGGAFLPTMKNIMHVPDDDEFLAAKAVLFG
jgi:hypothetical protein